MFTVAMILLGVAAMGLVGFLMQRHKAGRLGNTPLVSTSDAAQKGASVAGAKGAISVQGKLACAQPLVSPVTRTTCVYFETKVTAEWKVSDSEKRSVLVTERREAAPVAIDDGSGPVQVALSHLSNDDTKQVFKKSNKMGLLNVMDGRTLKFGDQGFTVTAGMPSDKGDRIPSDAEYTVVETVLPVLHTAYVAGKADGGKIVAPSWVSLMVSAKSRDELLAATASMMKRTKLVSLIAAPAGAVLAIIALVTGNGPGAKPAAPPATAKSTLVAPLKADAPAPVKNVAAAPH